MAVRKRNKKYVDPISEARDLVTTTVGQFTDLKDSLLKASGTLSESASNNRDIANSLVAEADELEGESAQSAKLADKLAALLS